MTLLTERDPTKHILMQAVVELAEELSVQQRNALANRIAFEVSKLLPKGK